MPAILTPFDERGELDLDAHGQNVRFLASEGIEGFVVAGSNGEGPYLEPGERAALVETTRDNASNAHVMVGIMAESVRGAYRQLDDARHADSVLVMTPTTLTRGRQQAVLTYFRHVADSSPLPVYLYSVPPNTAYSLPIEFIAELAEHENVVGMKDSSGDVVRLQAIVDATPDDFILYSGASAAATAALTVGCHGVITGSVNYAPRLVIEVVEKAPDRDLQSRLSALSAAVERHGVPGVKAAAAAIGMRPGYPRLPLEPVDGKVADQLAALVAVA
jgi:dihydrodipicolinate synthase/N-acetylneuraminate lyase